MPYPFQFATPTATTFGDGAAAQLLKQRPLRKAERIWLLSDEGVKAAGLLDAVQDGLGTQLHRTVDNLPSDSDAELVEGLAQEANEAGVDAIVAVGGGSVLDSAKGMAVVMETHGRLVDVEGVAKVRKKLKPLVCVPTTCGTGSEATQFAVVQDRRANKKVILTDMSVTPAVAVLDPTLLTSLPSHLVAFTAVDAISHATEALASRMANPFGRALALEALHTLLVTDTLQTALTDDDAGQKARGELLAAAHLAGHAISACMLGACHAFAHPLGALKGVHHGKANGLFLARVMQKNLERAAPAYARIGALLGEGGDVAAQANAAIARVEHVVHDVAGVPRSVADVGVTADDLDALVQGTLDDPDLVTNPVKLDEAAIRQVWQDALG